MNVIFLTQSNSVKMFYELMLSLKKTLDIDRVGFYVSHSRYYQEFTKENPDFESGKIDILKEWEIVSKAGKNKPNIENISEYEKLLGVPSLWEAIVADRRLVMGRQSAFKQDYQPKFDHDQILSILEEGLTAVDDFFERIKPDLVISFICVTFGEYLGYLFASSKGIKFLNLRPTRIKNYVTFGESIFEPSERIKNRYNNYMNDGIEEFYAEESLDFLNSITKDNAKYEGVIPPSIKPPKKKLSLSSIPINLLKLAKDEYQYFFKGGKTDHHISSQLVSRIYRRILNPRRAASIHRKLKNRYVSSKDLSSIDYLFFPLHTEPEVSLLVYSKSYLNQIEVIRDLCYSVPAGMQVLVKEHPASVGKRPLGYYRKILQIPNTRLVDPSVDSKSLIIQSKIIATIAGSIGQEAIFRQKPVLTFGMTAYEYLPDSMTRHIDSLSELANLIGYLINNYKYNKNAAQSFIAATMHESIPINLYSNLLEKRDVFSLPPKDRVEDDKFQSDILKISDKICNLVLATNIT